MTESQYPAALLDWAGHHSGGVRRLFDKNSGRPNKEVLRTNLLYRLESWAQQLVNGDDETPRIILLVGGPGNGKTEAIESTINWLDNALICNGSLVDELSQSFLPEAGYAVPRLVHIDASKLCISPRQLELTIVQDASVVTGREGKSPAVLLIEELCNALSGPSSQVYLCCVNRGILDDALIHTLDNDLKTPQQLLEAITRAVSLTPDAPPCWPLEEFKSIAVWPMDAESLLVQTDDQSKPPASILLEQALNKELWPTLGSCAAGDRCPFCNSQAILMRDGPRESLLKILRWYELGSGKRWSFRDLFSIISYLLAGHRPPGQEDQVDPCQWAAKLVEYDAQAISGRKTQKIRSSAIFLLATSSYQHALFHRWGKDSASSILRDIKDLGLEQNHTLIGLYHYLQSRKAPYLPATISSSLEGVVDLLDPALASPDSPLPVSSRSTVVLRELDSRFSRSTDEGIEFIKKYQTLSATEIDLLKRLAKVDTELSSSSTRRKKPAAASRIQRSIRDFACRLVRRSIGTKFAVVQDEEILASFQDVLEDQSSKGDLLFNVAREVEDLLNKGEYFEVSLTTTFGQPLPPPQRQATLVVPRVRVREREVTREGRPHSPICYLRIGNGQTEQSIALTYDLFKAVRELERGMSIASLPRPVVALLDTTRARLSGPIVRDRDILERAWVRIGVDGTAIERHRGGFASTTEGRRK